MFLTPCSLFLTTNRPFPRLRLAQCCFRIGCCVGECFVETQTLREFVFRRQRCRLPQSLAIKIEKEKPIEAATCLFVRACLLFHLAPMRPMDKARSSALVLETSARALPSTESISLILSLSFFRIRSTPGKKNSTSSFYSPSSSPRPMSPRPPSRPSPPPPHAPSSSSTAPRPPRQPTPRKLYLWPKRRERRSAPRSRRSK